MLTLLEEVMEEAQASMQQISLAAFLIGDFYEMVGPEKVENLEALHNA